jgi:hypothetical protein
MRQPSPQSLRQQLTIAQSLKLHHRTYNYIHRSQRSQSSLIELSDRTHNHSLPLQQSQSSQIERSHPQQQSFMREIAISFSSERSHWWTHFFDRRIHNFKSSGFNSDRKVLR